MADAPADEPMELVFKWGGKEYAVSAAPSDTLACVKSRLEALTGVRPERQKLLPALKRKADAAPAGDGDPVSALALKKAQKLMLLGTADAGHDALAAAADLAPATQEWVDDLGEAEALAGEPDVAARPEVQEKLARRVAAAKVAMLNPPRPGKKCLVVDIDYTIFDLNSPAERPEQLARPHLHEFFAAAYVHYDIVVWSANSMKWIDIKLRELGVLLHPEYKVTATMDYTAMVTVQTAKHGVYDCKPLHVLWSRFEGVYTPANTIMLDDLRRNYVCNRQQGLVVRPFRRALTSGRDDRELAKLKHYLLAIAELETLEGLDHDRWERYVRKTLQREGLL